MDVRQLAALVAIADHGSFSAAARALYTVQSNVSGHIARLERELGVRLVDRAQGGLTEEGARSSSGPGGSCTSWTTSPPTWPRSTPRSSGEARLGVIGTTARWLLPQLLGRRRAATTRCVHTDRPRRQHHHAAPEPASRAARRGHRPPARRRSRAGDRAAVRRGPAAARPRQPPVRRPLVDGARASSPTIPLLLPPKGTALRRVLDRAAATAGVTLRAQAEIDGVRLLASLAFEGYGAAIVPATAVPRRLKGDFTRIAVPELPRRVVGWVRRRRPAPSVAVQAVADAARARSSNAAPPISPACTSAPTRSRSARPCRPGCRSLQRRCRADRRRSSAHARTVRPRC